MLLTQSEWARQKGFSRQYAAKLIKQGTIRLTGGKVDTAQAETALAALREPLRQTSIDEPLEGGGQSLSTLLLNTGPLDPDDARQVSAALCVVPGVAEAVVQGDEGIVYLKVDKQLLDRTALENALALPVHPAPILQP